MDGVVITSPRLLDLAGEARRVVKKKSHAGTAAREEVIDVDVLV
jgi:hypothetical protein